MSEDILTFPNPIFSPTTIESTSYENFRGTNTPIVIDNGATTLRWGFASSNMPRCQPNIIAKYKERRSNKPLLLFGDAVELEGSGKAQAKTAWEGDVLLNFDALVSVHANRLTVENKANFFYQECALDYVFINLGIDTDTVSHPILMSERLATPSHSRACEYSASIHS